MPDEECSFCPLTPPSRSAELVIGPATSGRTRWRIDLATRGRCYHAFGCKTAAVLCPDFQLGNEPAQRRDHAQRHNAAGARILRWNSFNRHGEARGVGIDLDAMGVAGPRRVGP